jgi:hypothetical protein
MTKRILTFFLLLFLLGGLSYYGTLNPPWLKLTSCLEDPEKYDGSLVTYFSEPRIQEITASGFILHTTSGTIPVLSDTSGLRQGEYIGLTAIYHKAGYLTATRWVISKNRRYKIILSVIPVCLVAFLFFRTFRWNRRFEFEVQHA